MVQIVSVTPAGIVDDDTMSPIPELEVPAPTSALDVGATSPDENVGKLLCVALVLERWLECDVQVVLLQDCGLVESLMLLLVLLSILDTDSERVGVEEELIALEVLVVLLQGAELVDSWALDPGTLVVCDTNTLVLDAWEDSVGLTSDELKLPVGLLDPDTVCELDGWKVPGPLGDKDFVEVYEWCE